MKGSILVLALLGCAPPSSALRRPVDAELARRIGSDAPIARDDDATTRAVAERLAKPLDKTGAIGVALASNPRLAAALARLGVAGAGLAIALGQTEVHLQARISGDRNDYEIDVLQDVLGLITVARRRATARAELGVAQSEATALAIRLAARVEIAFHDLIAAHQALELRQLGFDAADAAALVRERMHAAGNTTALALARDRDAREQARIELGRAEATVEVRREAVNALLGVTGEQTKWTAAGTLPALPTAPPALDALESRAIAASLDLSTARMRVAAAANTAGEARMRAFMPRLGVGVSVHRDHDGATQVGPAVSLGVPLFDWNTSGRARANAELMTAERELVAIAIELRSAARAARITALATYQEARHLRDVVLPLRRQILDETLLQYNAMNADPFALIAARTGLADAEQQELDAVRRYWKAAATVTALERGVSLDREPDAPSAVPNQRSHQGH